MATYELPYAEEHLRELFQEARTGADVIIVRHDGRSCQLLPLGEEKERAPASKKFTIPGWRLAELLVPA